MRLSLFLIIIAIVAGNLIWKIGQEPQELKTKVKKIIVHDTVYVNSSIETYNLPKCEGALIDSLVIDKRKLQLMEFLNMEDQHWNCLV